MKEKLQELRQNLQANYLKMKAVHDFENKMSHVKNAPKLRGERLCG